MRFLRVIALFITFVTCQLIAHATYTAPGKVADIKFSGGIHYFGSGDSATSAYLGQVAVYAGVFRHEMKLFEIDGLGTTDNIGRYNRYIEQESANGAWTIILVNPGCQPGEEYETLRNNDFSRLVDIYADGCRRLAEYYKNHGYQRIIFELVNEPEQTSFWHPEFSAGDEFKRLINAGAAAIKGVWPGALVSSGGLAEPNIGYARDAINGGLNLSLIDYFSYHAYNQNNDFPEYGNGAPLTETPTEPGRIKELRTLLAGSGVDVLMTEVSWNSADPNMNEDLRAAYYMRAWLVHIRERVEGAITFMSEGQGPTATSRGFIIPLRAMQALPFIREAFTGNPKDDGLSVPSDATAVGINIETSSYVWSVGRRLSNSTSLALWQVDGPTTVKLYNIPSEYKVAQICNLVNPSIGWQPPISIVNGRLNGINVGMTPILVRLLNAVDDFPGSPKNLHATINDNSVTLSWDYSSAVTKTFKVFRADYPGGTFINLTRSVPASSRSYLDISAESGKVYTYRVYANDGMRDSAPAEIVAGLGENFPSRPYNITATATTSSVTLAWDYNSVLTKTFKVFRANYSDGTFTALTREIPPIKRDYTDSTVTSNGIYIYRIYANDGIQDSAYGQITAGPGDDFPAAPANISTTSTSSAVTLTWYYSSTVTKKFKVFRSSSPEGPFTKIAGDILATKRDYTDIGPLSPNTQYVYLLYANDDYCDSQAASLTVVTKPVAMYHPADTNPDWRITIDEVTAYGATWKRGDTWPVDPNPIPIEYVTNAGLIWRSGEKCHYDPSKEPPQCWIPGESTTAALARAMSIMGSPVEAQFVPDTNQSITVKLKVKPPTGALSYAIEDIVPEGVGVSEVNEDGVFVSQNKTVRWGPFFDNKERELTYRITVANSICGRFIGIVSFDGLNYPVIGARIINNNNLYILGDVNADGQRTMEDLDLLIDSILEAVVLKDEQKQLADIDGNGKVDMKDAVLWQKLK